MKTKITVKTELEIVLPILPNFVRTSNKDVCISIGELTEQQIKELGEAWTEALIKKARDKRKEGIREINKKLQKLG